MGLTMATRCAVCGKTEAKLLRCGRCSSRAYCGPKCQKEDWPTHKAECKRQNYLLKIDLLPRFITNPRITRTISCPASATFASFHQALLVAFGWANTHLYDFGVFDHSDTRGREHRLAGGEPIFKLTDLNTLDGDFGFGAPNRDSSKTTLFKVLDDPKTKGKTIHYNYDFGDGWEHVISCVGRTDATAHFVCLEGEGHGCAEDVGGYTGWEELLKAYDAEHPTEDQKDKMSWFETYASNKDPEGLRGEKKWRWDKDRVNVILSELGLPTRDAHSANTSHSVLLISLDKQSFFDDMYSEVLAKLRSKSGVTEVTHIASAMEHLSKRQEEYTAVVITDAGVMEQEFVAVQDKLVEYAQAGGTVILGFLFPSFAAPNTADKFFKSKWGLNWKVGGYHRETFSLSPQARANALSTKPPHRNLLRQYSMKALHLRNTKPEDRIYVASPQSAQSPAVFAKYGAGHLGWIGDVNTETGTTELLLTMCGV